MSEPERAAVEIVRAAYDATAAGDYERFLSLFAPGAVVQQSAGPPWVMKPEGEEITTFAERVGWYIRSAQTVDEIFHSGDEVIVIGRSRGEAVRTGRSFDVRIVHRWVIVDGAVVRWHLMVEQAPLLEALAE